MPSSDARVRPSITLITEYDNVVGYLLYGDAQLPPDVLSGGRIVDVVPGSLNDPPWTSQEYEAETGFQYNVARYYCPTVGAWATEDLGGLSAADINLYRYPAQPLTDMTHADAPYPDEP